MLIWRMLGAVQKWCFHRDYKNLFCCMSLSCARKQLKQVDRTKFAPNHFFFHISSDGKLKTEFPALQVQKQSTVKPHNRAALQPGLFLFKCVRRQDSLRGGASLTRASYRPGGCGRAVEARMREGKCTQTCETWCLHHGAGEVFMAMCGLEGVENPSVLTSVASERPYEALSEI